MKTKKIFLSVILAGCALSAMAQSDVNTATLVSGGNVSVFSGADALVQAHAAASEGDVITLSSGSFTSPTITKSVSIYGAGFEKDAATGTDVTQLRSDLNIGVADATVSNVHVEGLYINGGVVLSMSNSKVEGLLIAKCFLLNGMTFSNSATAKNMQVQNCILKKGITAANNTPVESASFVNSYVGGDLDDFPSGSSVLVDHCIVTGYAGAYTWKNSILTYWDNGYYSRGAFEITTGANVSNCVIRAVYNSWTESNNSISNCYYTFRSINNNIFSDITGTDFSYTPTRTFELTNAEWIGDDGTEAGIRGGDGWSKAPGIPVVKSMSLGVEGNSLKVSYEAEVR